MHGSYKHKRIKKVTSVLTSIEFIFLLTRPQANTGLISGSFDILSQRLKFSIN